MSSPANLNGSHPVIDTSDSVILLIDHQSELLQTVDDIPMSELRARAATLAKMTTLVKMSMITTVSAPQGPNGPLTPEIHTSTPYAQYVTCKSEINAWDNEDFVKAAKVTGCETLIIAGTIASVYIAFSAISAVTEGYKALAVIDVPSTYSRMAQEIALTRVVRADVVLMDTAVVASEIQGTWNREDVAEQMEVYTKTFPAYQLLVESYSKAQEVATSGEKLDSQR